MARSTYIYVVIAQIGGMRKVVAAFTVKTELEKQWPRLETKYKGWLLWQERFRDGRVDSD